MALRGETFDGAMTSTLGIEVPDTAVNMNANENELSMRMGMLITM